MSASPPTPDVWLQGNEPTLRAKRRHSPDTGGNKKVEGIAVLSMAPACGFRSQLEDRSLIELILAAQRRAVPQTMALQGVEEFQTRRKSRRR